MEYDVMDFYTPLCHHLLCQK